MSHLEMRKRFAAEIRRTASLIERARAAAERARELIAECRNTRHTIVLQRALAARFAQRRA